jgi:polysaccharide chain length determinant protein (PEP-CTERM system associated)
VLPGKKYTPEDIVRIAWRRKWLILLPFVVVTTVVAAVAYLLPDRYRSETLVMVVPQQVPEAYVKPTVTTPIEDRLSMISQQIMSRSSLEKVIQEFNLYPRERRAGIMEDVIARMRKDIDVQVIKGDAFSVAFTSSDPRLAMNVANRLAAMFIDGSKTDQSAFAESTTSFLQSQLNDARRRLEEQEKKLAEYKTRHAGELPSERDSNLQALNNLQMQVQAVVDAIGRDRDRRYQVERTIADLSDTQAVVPNVTISGDDPTSVAGGSTAAQLAAARAQLQVLQTRYTPDHPDIVRMKRVIKDLEAKQQAEALQQPVSPGASPRPATPEEAKRLDRLNAAQIELGLVNRQIAEKQAEEKRLRGLMAGYQARIEATPERESELTGLLRDYDTLRKTYDTLLAKQEDSRVAANLVQRQIGEQFNFLDRARLPERPVSPNRPLIDLFGALAGLGIGVGLVALLEYRDSSFRTDDDVVSVLALPVVAVIPLMLSRGEQRRLHRRQVIVGTSAALFAVSVAVAAAWFWWRYWA